MLISVPHHMGQRSPCRPPLTPHHIVADPPSPNPTSLLSALTCSIDELESFTKLLRSTVMVLLVPGSSGPCPKTALCISVAKLLRQPALLSSGKCIQYKYFTIDLNSVTKSCSVIEKPLDKMLGEL